MSFVVGALLFPTLIVLISTAVRAYKEAPVTSAADFIALAVVFDGLLLADPHQTLSHVKTDFSDEVASPITLLFLGMSFAVWSFCLYDLEPRIAEHYIKTTHGRRFPIWIWLWTWAGCLTVIVLQIAFFTGRVAAFTGRVASWWYS